MRLERLFQIFLVVMTVLLLLLFGKAQLDYHNRPSLEVISEE